MCQLGQGESLQAMYGHAYVMHASLGSEAISQGEKAKVKVAYPHDAHPYADQDSTIAQSYVHDDTGRAVIAAFPKRPVIQRKHCRKRATLAPYIQLV